MYCLPKIHKANAPLPPIVDSWGSITYNAARVSADVLSPLVGKTEHHIQNTGDFVNKVKDLEVPSGQKLVSYDVSALFTSIPVPDAIAAIEHILNSNPLLHKRTPSPANASLNCCFLPECHVLLVQRQHLQTKTWSGHGFAFVPYYSQPVHGGVQSQGHSHSPEPPI